MNLGETSKTGRGFGIVEFVDRNGRDCSLQASSAIDDEEEGAWENPGSSAIWLGCNDANPRIFIEDKGWTDIPMPKGYIANTRMHLSRTQVKALIVKLQCWVDTGSFEQAH